MLSNSLSLVESEDLPWIGHVVDIVAACRGKPWRIALERAESARYIERPVSPKQFAAVVGAIQRVLGGKARNAPLARACRSLVLGRPALSPAERTDRVASAARALELSTDDVERLLWADLPRERPVELPFGKPSELEVAAFANVQLVQRAMRRAHAVSLRVWGDAGPLLRGAATRGLLASACVGEEGEILIDIVGPLTLCHRTVVYGRALASLVPLLAECDRFEMSLLSRRRDGSDYLVEVASPVLLPALSAKQAAPPYAASRLARDLRRALGDDDMPAKRVVVAPPPILANGVCVCPDVVIDGHTYVEIVGFWTRPYLERKLTEYATAGVRVILCVDELRGCAETDELPAAALGYRKHVDIEALLARLASAKSSTRADSASIGA